MHGIGAGSSSDINGRPSPTDHSEFYECEKFGKEKIQDAINNDAYLLKYLKNVCEDTPHVQHHPNNQTNAASYTRSHRPSAKTNEHSSRFLCLQWV